MRRFRKKMIEDTQDLAYLLHCQATEKACNRALHAMTVHGAYLVFSKGGICIGPAWVDSLEEHDEVELRFPFQAGALWDATAEFDHEAEFAWQATHGCSHCGSLEVNPDCQHCHGVGVLA